MNIIELRNLAASPWLQQCSKRACVLLREAADKIEELEYEVEDLKVRASIKDWQIGDPYRIGVENTLD